MKRLKLDCGCQFDILQERDGELPLLKLDYQTIDYTCRKTWDLLGRGLTQGVFQLDSSLGKTYTKKLRPDNEEHLAALGALLRPGCLQAKDEHGVSMTEMYCKRKNNEVETTAYHPVVDNILQPTFNVLAYQEQVVRLAVDIAGFNPEEADSLRRGMGKKIASEVAKSKQLFIDKAKERKLLPDKQIEEVAEWMEKSNRYSFNKSHALRYGLNSLNCCFVKSHFPLHFFTIWLKWAKNDADPQTEIRDLVNDAKLFDIKVNTPRLEKLKRGFYTEGGEIYFGLEDIKGIGDANLTKLIDVVTFTGVPDKWLEFLVKVTPNISCTVINALIKSGALPYKMPRTLMKEEYRIFQEFTKTELKKLSPADLHSCDNLAQLMQRCGKIKKEGGICANYKRAKLLQDYANLLLNPTSKHVDTPTNLCLMEEDLLGVALTCSQLTELTLEDVTCTCKEFVNGRDDGSLIIGVKIDSLREYITKKGKSEGKAMAFLSVSDDSCAMDSVVVFAESYETYKDMLVEGNLVALCGKRDKKKQSFLVEKVWRLV